MGCAPRVELARPDPLRRRLHFRDFIVNQGLLQFDLLEQAVMREFGSAQL